MIQMMGGLAVSAVVVMGICRTKISWAVLVQVARNANI